MHKLVIYNLPVFIVALVSIYTLSPAAKTAKTKIVACGHESKKAPDSKKNVPDDFPVTNIQLEKKPLSRWVYEFEPLRTGEVLTNSDKYLRYLEKNMSDHDQAAGTEFENDQRFANALQYFIQQLLASNHKEDALKLEHRLARIQALHPEFVTK